MKKLLCVWELGGHLGHLVRLASLVPALRAEGFDVSFAISDLSSAAPFLSPLGVPIFQAPLWHKPVPDAPRPPVSPSEILLHHGYGDDRGLAGVFLAWRHLFEATAPDLVLGDYSPTALFVARSLGIRAAAIGSGFMIPPSVSPMPAYVPRHTGNRSRLEASDARVVAHVNKAAPQAGTLRLSAAHEIWQADEYFLCTYPELDLYAPRTGLRYWGIAEPLPADEPYRPAPGAGSEIQAFAYVKRGHDVNVLDALVALGWGGTVFAPDLPRELQEKYRQHRLQLLTEPVPLQHALPHCDVVICHAGHDTTVQALLHGKPVLLLPQQMEQRITAHLVQRLGAGVMPPVSFETPNIKKGLQTLIDASGYRERALAFARKYPVRTNVSQDIASRCGELVAGKGRARLRGCASGRSGVGDMQG